MHSGYPPKIMPIKRSSPQKPLPRRNTRKRLLLETMEDRILCSATVDPAPALDPQPAPAAATLASVPSATAADPAVLAPAGATQSPAASAQTAAARTEIVFVDTSVPGYQALLGGMDPAVEVVLLNGNEDGLRQIADHLAGRQGIAAIHLISHGTEASLTLGSTTLTNANMEGQYSSLLATIGQSLTEDGDLLIYGCNFGKDADGLLASETLARLTGADVASSTNPTGSASLGGDWMLEAQTGPIEAGVVVSTLAQEQWSGLLAPPPVQFFYIPNPEQAMLASMQAINGTVNGTGGMDSIIVITATENNTIIYYDQWENGYESNLAVPTQIAGTARTQIWGDGDATNGAPPGAAPGTDPVINAGTIITLRNTVPLPRVSSNVFFDGGDKIGASKTISISRAQIPLPTGSVISSAVEVHDTRYFDTTYIAPVGENTPRPVGVGTLFSDNFLYVMASQDNTTVQIDADNNGAFEQTVVLNEGQTVVSTTNVQQGGRVVANKPVQTNLFTGNDAASFATRSYSLVPNAQLTNDYFTPVGDSGDDVVLFVYNPNAAAITVSFETRTTSGTLPVIAAGATGFFVVPADTGTRLFTAGGQVFAALGAHDTNGVGSAHDWGFSMQPTANLSQFAVVGLGVGNSTNPPSAGGINVSPIWVTPLVATTVYVDNDGNPTTGLFLDPVTGSRYDQSFALAKLQTQRVTDTTGGDQDNSGMRLFTNDGTLISVAWGEDTAAPAGSPGFDAGTTVPALPVPEFYKTVDFAPGGDANGDGYFNSGDTLRYTLRIRNIGTQPVSNSAITDALPTSLVTYISNSTFIDQGVGPIAIADGGATAFPLDEGGYTILNLSPGNTTSVTFDVSVNGSLPSGISEVYNTGRLAYQIYNLPAVNSAALRGTVTGTTYVDRNNNGTQNVGEEGIAGVTLTLTGTDILGNAVSKVTTTDSLGRYVFTDLRESNGAGYTVTQTQPTGYTDGLEARGGTVIPGSGGGPNVINTIAVMPGENDTNNNFGELGGTITGTVYVDASNNGTQQAWELGIIGVTVTLTGTDVAGNPVNVSTVTDANGNYSFGSVRASNATGYTITETHPTGHTDGLDARQGVVIGGSNATDAITPPIVLASGGTSTTNTFGEIPNFALTKTLEATGVAGTIGSNLAIGETATFRLVVSVPTGGYTDFQIQDALPNGFQFVNGSARVSLVSSAGQLTSSTLAGAGLAQTSIGTPTFAMPGAAVSDNSVTDSDVYVSGTDVFFKLGTLINTDTSGATTESVVIEFQAVVVNEVANQAATSLPNNFTALFEKNGVAGPEVHGAASNTVTGTVVEPVLGITKAVAVAGNDAGDAVQYTVTITNAGGNNAAAYDINLTDVLASTLTFVSVSASGATITTNTTAGNNINIVLDTIAAGASATITINATVASTAPVGSTIGNSTTVTWTSTPGANPGERNGGGGINDYTGAAASGTFTLARPTVDKLTPADTTYSIGETVTYDILVTLPEGDTLGLAITDNLPAGLDFVSAAVQTAAGGALANAFNGTVPAFAQSNAGNSYTFTFGSTTTAGDNVANNNSFLVRVTARVANVIGNQNAVTLTNTATLAYNDGTLGATTVVDPTPNVNITVVEPALTLDKSVVGASTGFDAGDTAQFQIVITNTGTATANEVLLSDALPAGLLVTTINSTTPAGGASVDTATAGTGTATLTGEYTIPVGGSITILHTATLQNSVTPNTNFINTATVTFSSVDGTALGQGTATGERVGSSPNIQGDGSLNDYRLQDTAQIATGGVLAVAKGVDNSTPSIGDVLTYTVTLTLNEGTTNGIVVTDTLPVTGDLQFVPGSAAVSFGTAGSSISGSAVPVVSGGTGNVLTFTLGTAVVPTGAGADTVVLTYQVLVTNVLTNQAGDMEGNSASVVATSLPPPPPGTTSVTLREPTLTFSKNATTGGPVGAGDPVTYTLTFTNPAGANAANAFDALVRDTMPADILITSIDSTVLAGGATADNAAAITGGGTGLSGQFDLPVGGSVTITYTGTLQLTATSGSAQTNNAELTWTSRNGGNSLAPDANERFGAPGVLLGDGSLNDYRLVGSQTITVATATFDKQLFNTGDAATPGSSVAIGETVTYALVVNVPAGSAPSLSIVDTLPVGLQYVAGSASVVMTVAGSNGLLTQNFNGTVPAPVVTGGASDGDDVNIDFGAITANADGNPANNRFLVLLTVRVTDIPANEGILPGQTSLANSAQFDIPGDGVPPFTPPPVTLTVIEPVLAIAKTFNAASADAGDTVQISIVVNNTGNGPAHDVLVTDVVNLAKFGSITAVTTPAGFTFNNAAGTVTFGGGTIAAGTSETFIFSVVLADSVNPSEVLGNTASSVASSQPGIVIGERNYGPVSDTATLPVPAVFNVTKGITSPVGGNVLIGDTVTYQVTVTLVEGTTQNISLSDTLPAGMTYVPGSAVVSNANGMTVNGFTANEAGNVLTIGATSVVNPGNVDNAAATDSDSFTITYQALVNDVVGNAAGTLLTNNLTGTGTGVPPPPPTSVPATVTEPRLKVTKAADDATPDLGQTVHFTLTIQNLAVANGAAAYDILVRDTLPARTLRDHGHHGDRRGDRHEQFHGYRARSQARSNRVRRGGDGGIRRGGEQRSGIRGREH